MFDQAGGLVWDCPTRDRRAELQCPASGKERSTKKTRGKGIAQELSGHLNITGFGI